jgi:hypothetical protein
MPQTVDQVEQLTKDVIAWLASLPAALADPQSG